MSSIGNIFKAIISSMSMLIPGISGGTTMIALGIYYKCIYTLDEWTRLNFINRKFMLELGIGSVIGLGLFSRVINFLLQSNSLQLQYFFYGIIFIGLVFLFLDLGFNNIKASIFIYIVFGLLTSLIMTFIKPSAIIGNNLPFIVEFIVIIVAGIIVAVALILPGISTSFVLLTLGLYEDTIIALKEFQLSFIIPLLIGIIIGVILTTRALSSALKNHEGKTKAVIIGFVIGSMIDIFPGIPTGNLFINSIIPFILGGILLIIINYLSDKLDNKLKESELEKGSKI